MTDAPMPRAEQLRRFGFEFDSIPSFGEHMDFWSHYQAVANAAPPGSTLIEVGCFHGRGLVCLGLMAKEANKGLKVFGVDNGTGMNPAHNTNPIVRANLKKSGLEGFVTLIEKDSVTAAKDFADDSCWWVFIDAGHLHPLVEADTLAWMPKVAKDGWLGYHDAIMYTVAETVIAMFGEPTFDADKDSGAGNVQYFDKWQDIFLVKKQEPHRLFSILSGTKMPNIRKDEWKP